MKQIVSFISTKQPGLNNLYRVDSLAGSQPKLIPLGDALHCRHITGNCADDGFEQQKYKETTRYCWCWLCWLVVGFGLLGCTILSNQPQSAATHALAAGAMMTMILAVAARAALGHTNREVTSSPPLTLCFALITLAAVMRVLAIFTPFYGLLLAASAITALLALGLFNWLYLPVLLQPSVAQVLPIVGAKAR